MAVRDEAAHRDVDSAAQPAVSVLIPTYNRSPYLLKAVRSVLTQSYPNVVVCVYDNASTDDTQREIAAVAARDGRVRYHRHPENIGAMANFRFALDCVDTPFFLFLSDDDFLLPGFVEAAVRGLSDHPDAMFFAGSTVEMTPAGDVVYVALGDWPRDGYFTPHEGAPWMLFGRHTNWTTMLFRSEVVSLVGPIDGSFPRVVDLEFTLRVASRYPFLTSFEPAGVFLRHPGSSSEGVGEEIADDFERMIDRLAADAQTDPVVRSLVNERLREHFKYKLVEVAVRAMMRRDFTTARRLLDRRRNCGSDDALAKVVRIGAAAIPAVPALFGPFSLAVALRMKSRAIRTGRGLGGRAAATKKRLQGIRELVVS